MTAAIRSSATGTLSQHGHGVGLGCLDGHGHRLRHPHRPRHPGHHTNRQRRGFVVHPHCRYGSPWHDYHLHHRRFEHGAFDCHRSLSRQTRWRSTLSIGSDTWTATAAGGSHRLQCHRDQGISPTALTIPAGGSVTYTVVANIVLGSTGNPVEHGHGLRLRRLDGDGHRLRHPHAHATLAITKTDGVTSVTAGTTDTYTVVVSNTGPSDAANLSVVDTLPSQGLTNISSPNLPSGVTFTAASDSWSLASLPAGQSVTLIFAGTVPSGATGSTYVNTATASASDASTVTATDSDSLTAQATLASPRPTG